MRTAFIFDDVTITPDRQIGLHSHDRWELSYVRCGAGTRTIGDLSEPFSEGDLVIIPPNIPHVWHFDPLSTDHDGNIANLSVFFDSSLLSRVKTVFPEMETTLTALESMNRAISYTGTTRQHLIRLLYDMRPLTPEKRLPVMLELLSVAATVTPDCRCAGQDNTLTLAQQRLENIRVYCDCNYSRPITLDEISRYVGMNKSAFCTFMRRAAGTTFSDFLNDIRLDRAREKILNTNDYIAEIAISSGFQNVTYFNRLFRKKYGRSPRSLRSITE